MSKNNFQGTFGINYSTARKFNNKTLKNIQNKLATIPKPSKFKVVRNVVKRKFRRLKHTLKEKLMKLFKKKKTVKLPKPKYKITLKTIPEANIETNENENENRKSRMTLRDYAATMKNKNKPVIKEIITPIYKSRA